MHLAFSDSPRSSYDFGYLIRVLTNQKLPDEENEFFELMSLYFPKVYDVKYLMKSCKSLKGGLQEVGDSLEVREGVVRPCIQFDSLAFPARAKKKQFFVCAGKAWFEATSSNMWSVFTWSTNFLVSNLILPCPRWHM